MTWQLNAFSLIFLLATVMAGIIFVYTFRHQKVEGATYFLFLVASAAIWAFFVDLEYSVVEIENKILFAKFQYIGITTIGITWYLFSQSYNRKDNRYNKNHLLLLIVPLLATLLVFTNEFHQLVWTKIVPVSSEPGASLIYSHGPAFWLIFIYDYIFLVLGTIIIIRTALVSKEIHRSQMIGLVASGIIPWLGNMIYITGLSPVAGLDLTPLGFIISAIIIAWSIFLLRLFDLTPVARDQLMENLADGVIVLDGNNRVAEINPKAREFLELQNKVAVGRDVIDFLQSRPELAERFRDVQSGQAEVYLGDQTVSDIDIRISPLLDNRKNRIGKIVTIRDISEQKKLERMRENLTRSIVHDLRNPLASMALGLDMLRKQLITVASRAQLETLDVSLQGAQQMLDLVDSLQDIYRLENGEMPLNRKKVSLTNVAMEATRSVAMLANRKRILIQLDIPQEMPWVMIDSNLMRRVFQNLLDTSVTSLSEGRVVRVQAGFDASENAVVASVINVGNDGEGLNKNIFEKHTPGQDTFNGNGLGMEFCRLVVEAHGGRIWLDERYQGGTKISLTIPEWNKN